MICVKIPFHSCLIQKLINPVNVNLLILLHLNGIPINIRVPSNAKYKLDANVAIDPDVYID